MYVVLMLCLRLTGLLWLRDEKVVDDLVLACIKNFQEEQFVITAFRMITCS